MLVNVKDPFEMLAVRGAPNVTELVLTLVTNTGDPLVLIPEPVTMAFTLMPTVVVLLAVVLPKTPLIPPLTVVTVWYPLLGK